MSVPFPGPGDAPRGATLADPRAWLAGLLELLPFPALLVEPGSGRAVLASRAAVRARLAGGPGGQASDRCYATDAAGHRLPEDRWPRARAARGDRLDGYEITWHTPERAVAYLVYSGGMPPLGDHPPLALVTFVDLNRQKAVEAELRAALGARDEFFSVATHELKDPLFSLQLSLQLLRHTAGRLGPIPEHVLHHLEVSERQAARLAGLIENLLDVARINNDRLQLEPEELDLAGLTRDVVERFQPRAHAAGSELAAEAPAPLVGRYDRMKMEQVLTNLLANALKYGAGRPVTVRTRGGGAAVLEVEDHGPGIAPEDQERIFRRFERASDSYKKESLGLGLYIARSLVEAHGGTLGVRSAPGRGSTFTVTLPCPHPAPGAKEE